MGAYQKDPGDPPKKKKKHAYSWGAGSQAEPIKVNTYSDTQRSTPKTTYQKKKKEVPQIRQSEQSMATRKMAATTLKTGDLGEWTGFNAIMRTPGNMEMLVKKPTFAGALGTLFDGLEVAGLGYLTKGLKGPIKKETIIQSKKGKFKVDVASDDIKFKNRKKALVEKYRQEYIDEYEKYTKTDAFKWRVKTAFAKDPSFVSGKKSPSNKKFYTKETLKNIKKAKIEITPYNPYDHGSYSFKYGNFLYRDPWDTKQFIDHKLLKNYDKHPTNTLRKGGHLVKITDDKYLFDINRPSLRNTVHHELGHARTVSNRLLPRFMTNQYMASKITPEARIRLMRENPGDLETVFDTLDYHTMATEFETRMKNGRRALREKGIVDYMKLKDNKMFSTKGIKHFMDPDMPEDFKIMARLYDHKFIADMMKILSIGGGSLMARNKEKKKQ